MHTTKASNPPAIPPKDFNEHETTDMTYNHLNFFLRLPGYCSEALHGVAVPYLGGPSPI